MTSRTTTRLLGALAIPVALLAGTLYGRRTAGTSHAIATTHFPLGDTIPVTPLQSVTGDSVELRSRLRGAVTLIYVFGAAECAGCSNLPLEFTIVRRAFPNIHTLLIGSGSPAATFAPFFKDPILRAAGLIDEDRHLLTALRLTKEPMVLLVDSSARVVFADARSASQAAQYPMGRILHDLSLALAPARRDTAPRISSNRAAGRN